MIEALASRRSVFTRYDDNLARHIYLGTLQDINEALFYKLVTDPSRRCSRSCAPRLSPSCPSTPRSDRDQATGQGVYGCDRAARTRPWK